MPFSDAPTIAVAGVWAAVTTATACEYAGHVAGEVGLESLSVHWSMWISQRLPRAKPVSDDHSLTDQDRTRSNAPAAQGEIVGERDHRVRGQHSSSVTASPAGVDCAGVAAPVNEEGPRLALSYRDRFLESRRGPSAADRRQRSARLLLAQFLLHGSEVDLDLVGERCDRISVEVVG